MDAQAIEYRALVKRYLAETNRTARKALASRIYWTAMDLITASTGIERAAYCQAVEAYRKDAGY